MPLLDFLLCYVAGWPSHVMIVVMTILLCLWSDRNGAMRTFPPDHSHSRQKTAPFHFGMGRGADEIFGVNDLETKTKTKTTHRR